MIDGRAVLAPSSPSRFDTYTDHSMSKTPHAPSTLKTKELERAELEHGRLAVIGAITSGLGHDLRNAIMPALLRLDTLTATASLSDATRRELHEVRSSLSMLQGLASGLHLLASDAELPAVATRNTELHRWWHDVKPLVHAATAAGTTVESHVPNSLPTVTAPPNLLAQILLALVLHARECMQGSESPQLRVTAVKTKGGATVTLEFFARTHDGTIADLGKRTTSLTAPIESMSGMTLDNLKLLLAEHGGNLTQVECAADGGVFTIELAAGAQLNISRSDALSARVELTDLRQRAVVQLVLAQCGYSHSTSTTHNEASNPPSVIVCDSASVQGVLDSLSSDEANGSPNLIVIGTSPLIPLKAAHVTWIAPTQLGLLASALP